MLNLKVKSGLQCYSNFSMNDVKSWLQCQKVIFIEAAEAALYFGM